jgi:hypothetical protein
MSRFRASAIHFGICVFVACVLIALLWFVWYPTPLLNAVGGTEVVLMLLGIDVVLGPVLTLIVFKHGKKTLKFDLAVIAAVQFVALCYGVYTLFIGRPVYVAALGHRFDVVQANDVDAKELQIAKQSLPFFGPQWVGVQLAADNVERERILFSAIGGIDYGHFPQHHQPIENMREEILSRAQTIYELKKLNVGGESAIEAWLASYGLKSEDVRFQGLKARSKDFAVILNAKTAEIVGIAPFRPWP